MWPGWEGHREKLSTHSKTFLVQRLAQSPHWDSVSFGDKWECAALNTPVWWGEAHLLIWVTALLLTDTSAT